MERCQKQTPITQRSTPPLQTVAEGSVAPRFWRADELLRSNNDYLTRMVVNTPMTRRATRNDRSSPPPLAVLELAPRRATSIVHRPGASNVEEFQWKIVAPMGRPRVSVLPSPDADERLSRGHHVRFPPPRSPVPCFAR
jgi:hypothetical protein